MTIAEIRQKYGLSRKNLADLLKVSVPSICRYENGQRKLPVEKAKILAEAVGIPWHILYE